VWARSKAPVLLALALTVVVAWPSSAGPGDMPNLPVDARREDAARQLQMVLAQDRRLSAAVSLVKGQSAPFVAVVSGARNLILPARSTPYGLAELAEGFPASLASVSEPLSVAGAPPTLVLEDHLVVAPGARLVISSSEVASLRLASNPDHYATIMAREGDVDFVGTESRPLSVTSWSSDRRLPDSEEADGRAFVLARSARMNVDWTRFSDLGFHIGRSSGVAWLGSPGRPSGGRVTNSRFERNHFGAFTFRAVDMYWARNVFADNAVYGFDPHDFTNGAVIENNEAYGNSRHGFILSRGCSGNLIRNNDSHHNGMHGFVLDDGRSAPDAPDRPPVPSDDNEVTDNRAWLNGEVGIAVEGGARNVVSNNTIFSNRFGVRLKAGAQSTVIAGNHLADNSVFGVYIYERSAGTRVEGNKITDGKAGLMVSNSYETTVQGNSFNDIEGHAAAFVGDVRSSIVARNDMAGRGSSAVDLLRAADQGSVSLRSNDARHWEITPGFRPVKLIKDTLRHHPLLSLWLVILVPPVLSRAWALASAKGGAAPRIRVRHWASLLPLPR
jgi:parallel beta-helix repeat protein